MARSAKDPLEHGCSVVIPVFRGEQTLPLVVEELSLFTEHDTRPGVAPGALPK